MKSIVKFSNFPKKKKKNPGGFAPWTPANALCAASPPPSALGLCLRPRNPHSSFGRHCLTDSGQIENQIEPLVRMEICLGE